MSKPIFSLDTPIGTRLREVRKWRKLTLTQLKNVSGVAVGTLSDVENNIRQPNTSTLLKLSRALEVSLKTLTGL